VSEPRLRDSHPESSLALRFHFLLEAVSLDLLPSPLDESVRRLAAAAEVARDIASRAREVEAAYFDAQDELLLGDIGWPAAGEEAVVRAAEAALVGAAGAPMPLDAAERLGRFCEDLANHQSDRRKSGSYYTPGWAARSIADTVVQGVLKGRGWAGPRRVLGMRVLDPAAGAGAFAVAAVEALAAAAGEGEEENECRRAAVRECIFGVEMNPLAAEACRLGIWVAASRPGRPAALPAEHLIVGDALSQPLRKSTFDVVVGNPPWGVKLGPARARKLAEPSPEALGGHRDSYLFFLQLASRRVGERGGIGMLLPDVVLWQVRYEGIRRALLERFRPLRVMLLGDRIFPGATAPACALCLAGTSVAPDEFATSDLRRVPRAQLEKAVGDPGWLAPRDAAVESLHHSLLVAPGWQRELLGRMHARHGTLGESAGRFEFHDVGINYPRAEVGRAVLYSGEREDRRDIPVVRGRDFGALTEIGHSAWLRHDWRNRKRPADGLAVRESVYRVAPKLLLRQTGDRPVATVDRRGVWFGRSVIAITGQSQRGLLWLAGVLNSEVFAALYRAVAPEAGRPFAQVKVSKLEVVPVPAGMGGALAAALTDAAGELLEEADEGRRAELAAKIEGLVARAYGLTQRERELAAKAVSGPAGGRRSRRARHGGTSSARSRA
jgi:predicted RNA methylase